MRNVLSKYRIISTGNELNVGQNILIDNEDIGIPLNLPTFIVASKNGGKSTIISTLISAERYNDIYTRIIYIYTDHVDSTLAETCHETLIRVPLNQSIEFITEYFKIKSEFISWIKFLDHNFRSGNITNELRVKDETVKIDDLLRVYTDNIIDAYVRNTLNINKTKKQSTPNIYDRLGNVNVQGLNPNASDQPTTTPTGKILGHACEFIEKYRKRFEIVIDDTTFYIEGLQYNQFDQLIIDDVGVAAPYLFPTTQAKSPLYKFLTISRHILLGTIIAGQDIMQLPKYARKEVNTYMFGVGLDISTVENTNIPKNRQREIIADYPSVKQYDFILYNGVNNTNSYFSLNS